MDTRNRVQQRVRGFLIAARKGIIAAPVISTLPLLAASLMPVSTRAADVYLEPSVGAAMGHDDNLRLEPDGEDSQTGAELTARAELGAKTRTREAVLNAATTVNRYSDSELDSTDWALDLNLLQRWRRDELSLLASYEEAATITTELEDTGVLETDQTRKSWRVSPSWTHRLSRRTDTTLSYQFTDTSFEGGGETGLVGFQEHFVESRLTHSLSRTMSVNGRADYTHFDSEGGTTSDDVSLLVGLEYNLSRTFNVGASLGARHIESESPAVGGGNLESSDDGLVYEAFATWTLQRSMFNIEGSRSLQSSGLGTRSEVDSVTATWTRSLTRAWDLRVNGGASWIDFAPADAQVGQGGIGALDDRLYYDAEIGVTWRGRPQWDVDLSYQYRRQEFDEPVEQGGEVFGTTADSNAIWLTLHYNWRRMNPFR